MNELFELLYEQAVTPNGWHVLTRLASGEAFWKNYISHQNELLRLKLTGHVCPVLHPDQPAHYTLTLKGRQLVDEVEDKLQRAPKAKKLRAVPFAEWEPHILRYIELFPKGSQGSAPYRSPAKMLYDRFKWFFETYSEFDWDLVLRATDHYITQLENSSDGFKYLSTSKYFIKKQEGDKTNMSRLADWCQALRDGGTESLSQAGFLNSTSHTV